MPYNVKSLSTSKAVDFLKSNGIYLLAVVFLIPYIVRYFKNEDNKDEIQKLDIAVKKNNAQNGKSDPNIIRSKESLLRKKYPKMDSKTSARVRAVAQGVAISLGTNVEDNHFVLNTDLFNVAAWGENEAEAVKLLKTVPGTFPAVEDYYYSLFTRSRNLKTDLLKYLSKSDLSTLRATYKKYGFNNI